jgi:hypothetical protein
VSPARGVRWGFHRSPRTRRASPRSSPGRPLGTGSGSQARRRHHELGRADVEAVSSRISATSLSAGCSSGSTLPPGSTQSPSLAFRMSRIAPPRRSRGPRRWEGRGDRFRSSRGAHAEMRNTHRASYSLAPVSRSRRWAAASSTSRSGGASPRSNIASICGIHRQTAGRGGVEAPTSGERPLVASPSKQPTVR